MASIGNLVAYLDAKDRSFGRTMTASVVKANLLSKAIWEVGRGLTSWSTSLGRNAAEQMTAVDQQVKFARRLGVTHEALVGLNHAAEMTGVSIETMQMGLQRMTRRIAEAAQGTGEARGAIAELGLSADRLVSRSPDQAFMDIAEALKHVDNQADRVRLTFKLFDSEGVALVNTLEAGREGLEKMADEAERLNKFLSESQIEKIEEANQAAVRAEEAWEGLGAQVAAATAPVRTGWMNFKAKLYEELGSALAYRTGGKTGLEEQLEKTEKTAQSAAEKLQETNAAIRKQATEAGAAARANREWTETLADAQAKADQLQRILGRSALRPEEVGGEGIRLYHALRKEGISALQMTGGREGNEADLLQQRMEGLVRGFGSAADAARVYKSMIDESLSPLEKYRARLEDITRWQGILSDRQIAFHKEQAKSALDEAMGGPQRQYLEMVDEIQRRRAGASEFEWQVRKWENLGLDAKSAAALRAADTELARLRERDMAPQIEDEAQGSNIRFAGAAAKGSQEAYRAILQATGGRQPEAKQQLGVAREHLRVAKDAAEVQRRLLGAVEEEAGDLIGG